MMKNGKSFIQPVLCILLTVAIIGAGALAMLSLRRILPNYKNSTVDVDLPLEDGGLYFAHQNTDLSLSYPWSILSESDSYISSAPPQWIIDSTATLGEAFELDISTKDGLSYICKDGVWFINAKTNDAYNPTTVQGAFLEGGKLISFRASQSSTGATSEEINTAYETIGKAAYNNQNKKDGLIRYLDTLRNKKPIPAEKDPSYPLCDFFSRYCAYSADASADSDSALHVYTILRYGTYACIYSEDRIFLVYNLEDFGKLTLSWNVSNSKLVDMILEEDLSD